MTVVFLNHYRSLGRHVAARDEAWNGVEAVLAHGFQALEMIDVSERETRKSSGCAAVEAYDRVCLANDTWGAHIPGDSGDHASVSELERAYDCFYGAQATSMEGLRLQFESLVAITDVESDDEIHPRVLVLLENMRHAFQELSAKPELP